MGTRMSGPARALLVLISILLTHLTSWALPSAAEWGGFRDGWRFTQRVDHATGHRDAQEASRQDSLHSWDALRYQADLTLGFNPAHLDATVSITFAARETLSWLDLHLRGYEIHSIRVEGQDVAWSRNDDRLSLDLSAHPVAAGDSAHVELQYSGTPVVSNDTGLFMSSTLAYTLSDPWGTRNWLACFDEPFDKALWQVSVRADSLYSTLSNGTLQSVVNHGDGTSTWTYRHDLPMSSYLVSLVTGRLTDLADVWQGHPLHWFVYPQHVAAAQAAVTHMPEMLDCFSGYWGDYPFDSYAMGEAPIYGGMGGMEHQTCTTIGSGIIAGGLQYESIIAHELSHMWWGDALTPVDYRQVWLNEGWATYAEALFFQYLANGDEAVFQDYLVQIQQTYLNWDTGFQPIFAPPANDLFNLNQYEKAASVLHMLRDLLGRELFDATQREWQATHRYGTVSTDEYREALEVASGLELDWFFHQWIYTGGYPTYQHVTETRQQDSDCRVHLTVNQSHPRLDAFRARVPLRLVTSAVTLDTTIWVDQQSMQFSWTLPGQFDTLIFNHLNTVLCRQLAQPAMPGPPLWHVQACHLDDRLGGNGDGDLAQGETAWLSLDVENVGGWDTNVQFSLSSNDLSTSGSWATVPDAGSGMHVLLPFDQVAVSGWNQAASAYASLVLHTTSDSYPEQLSEFRLPVGDPHLKLATSDSQNSLRPFYQTELDSLLEFSDSLNVAEGLPSIESMEAGTLLWFTGATGESLTEAEQNWVGGHAEFVGKAFVGGQDAWDSIEDQCFFRALHADLPEVLVEGMPGTPFEGLSALLIGAGGAQNQSSPSSLEFCPDMDDCSSQVFAVYANSREPAILGWEICDGPLVLVGSGFGFESISGLANTSSRREWLAALMQVLENETVLPPTPRPVVPSVLELGAPHPNPFNPLTHIPFTLSQPMHVRATLYDLLGRVRCRLVDKPLEAGSHDLQVDGSAMASGLYVVAVEAGECRTTRKVLLMK